MRILIIAGAALFAAAPLAAQPYDYDDDRDERMEAAIDPAEAGRVAYMMDRMVGAVMDLPIGGIVAAVDPLGRSGYHPGATVRDMAQRDDPYAERRIRSGIRGAARGVGAMNEALARMIPVLRRSLDEMRATIEDVSDDVEYGRPY